MIEFDEFCLILGICYYLDGIMFLLIFLYFVVVFKSFLIEVLWEFWEVDIFLVFLKYDVFDDYVVF